MSNSQLLLLLRFSIAVLAWGTWVKYGNWEDQDPWV